MESLNGFVNRVTTSLPFAEALDTVTRYLADEGFGVLTEIDVQATMKKKLDVDHKPYKILGVCNPPFAHKAIESDNLVGVLLPCNVVVIDEGDHRVVAAMDPRVIGQLIPSDEMVELADQVGERLSRMLSRVETGA